MKNQDTTIGIWGVGVVAPSGVGLAAYREAMSYPASRSLDSSALSFAGDRLPPETAARVVENFDAKRYLGAKGLSSLDRTTQFTILGADLALQDGGFDQDIRQSGDFGVVLGSASGSIRSIADFAYSTYTSNPPYTVSAMDFPKTVMNSAAGQCAIRHKLTGLNSTICAGTLSSMLAFRYSTLMLRLGRAQVLLAGGVEEYCAWSAWSHNRRCHDTPELPFGEGCALFALSMTPMAAGSRHYGDILACTVDSSAVRGRHPAGSALNRCVRIALKKTGLTPASLQWWSGQNSSGAVAVLERESIEALAGDAGRQLPRIDDVCHDGDFGSASTAFQLATAIAAGARGVGVITGTSPDGQVGCLIVDLVQ